MSDIPVEGAENGDVTPKMSSVIENFQKKAAATSMPKQSTSASQQVSDNIFGGFGKCGLCVDVCTWTYRVQIIVLECIHNKKSVSYEVKY